MTFNWPILLFGVTMVGLVAGYIFTRMALFIPLVAVVLYLGVEFNLWQWLVWIFWISVILALLAIPVGFFRPVRRFIRITGGIALAVAVFAVSFGTWWIDDDKASVDVDVDTEESATTSTSTTSTTVEAQEVGDVVVDPQEVADLFETETGRPPTAEDLVFQEEAAALMEAAAQERGARAHSDETLFTVEDLMRFLASPEGAEIRERVVNAVTAECGADDVAVHLEDGQGWLLMVVRPASQIMGTSYETASGGIEFASNWRAVGMDDAYWAPVCTAGANEGNIADNGLVRADCGNGHDNPRIRIPREDTPDVPPVEIPPGNPCPYNPALPVDSPDCLKPKDPTADPLVNRAIPEQVRGEGTTSVGEDPGPPVNPVDSPTGCDGPCPTTQPPTTQPPPSGGGSTPTTVPGCGGSGQPSCSNTGVTPPTTTAPPAPPPPDQPPQDGMPDSP